MIRQLLRILDPDSRRAVQRMVVWQSVNAVAQGALFALTAPVLEALLGPHPEGVWPPVGVLVAASVLYGLVHGVSLRSALRSSSTLSYALHTRIGNHLAALPLGWYTAERVGQLSTLLSQGVVSIMGIAAHLIRPLVTGLLTPATIVVALVFFDWRLAVLTAITIPALVVVFRWAGRLSAIADSIQATAQAEAAGRIIEYAALQPVLRSHGASGAANRLVDAALTGKHDASAQVLRASTPGRVGFALALQTAFTLVLAAVTGLVLADWASAVTALPLLVLIVRFIEPLTETVGLASTVQRSRGALARIAAILDAEPLPEPTDPSTPAGNDIQFDRVGFGYADRPVLADVTARLPEGTVTALVGPSGSGKTTLTRLVARFWDTDTGAVRIGGVDVRDIATPELMSRIAIVFQDVYLFHGTIAENVRLGKPDATDAELRAAARAARLDDVLDRARHGWDTPVGEGGLLLSGGERQRVSIARALLKNAPIVLLDEATSALDPETENAVQAAITALTRDRTVLVVAHKLDTIRHADRILFLDDGHIVEDGTHEALLSAGGRYARFWTARAAAAEWHLDGAELSPAVDR
ncbi:ABC transporter ATP-binding protein [Pseudonocardia sp. CA-107938]|uniref:ABC transporter ATP-binding protein n=1 Tax=Pseudonocardia sp. CA-107938 TaxID=3240021 RepID=UPI003D940441